MPSPWAAQARTRCSDCGSTALVWTTAIDLPWRAMPGPVPLGGDDEAPIKKRMQPSPDDPDLLAERKRMWHAINWCGPDAEAWWCPACKNWGIFSDLERRL